MLKGRFETQRRQCQLSKVVRTTDSPRRLSNLLNRRQQHTDEDPNDRDNDQQLDKSESFLVSLNLHFRSLFSTDKLNVAQATD
jgi:hypothetical protein